eukprot:scaffold2200_cov413-Prasinococcus_capsulatus_cf.AAC.34
MNNNSPCAASRRPTNTSSVTPGPRKRDGTRRGVDPNVPSLTRDVAIAFEPTGKLAVAPRPQYSVGHLHRTAFHMRDLNALENTPPRQELPYVGQSGSSWASHLELLHAAQELVASGLRVRWNAKPCACLAKPRAFVKAQTTAGWSACGVEGGDGVLPWPCKRSSRAPASLGSTRCPAARHAAPAGSATRTHRRRARHWSWLSSARPRDEGAPRRLLQRPQCAVASPWTLAAGLQSPRRLPGTPSGAPAAKPRTPPRCRLPPG